jgi:hypothetical protein
MEQSKRGVRFFYGAVGVATALALSPVIGMLLVFALLPAFPIALAVGAVLWPLDLMEPSEGETQHRFGYRRWFEVPVDSHEPHAHPAH